MAENPNIEYNTFILCAAFRKEPIFDTYRNLCKLHPTENIDYMDFEWRFYKFYHGSRDLTLEMPPSPENSSPATFSDLPMLFLEKVVAKMDLVSCLVVRKVSRNLRRLVDSSELHCDRFYLHFGDRSSTIELDGLIFIYKQIEEDSCEVSSRNQDTRKIFKDDGNFEKVLLSDISTFLSNPKLRIDSFVFKVYPNDARLRFLNFFESLHFKLNVRSIDIEIGEMMMVRALGCLEPETLEEISFDPHRMSIDRFNDIAETEQWKMARKFSCRSFREEMGMEKFLYFKELRINQLKLSHDNIIMIRDVLLRSEHLKSGHIEIEDRHWNDYDDPDEIFDHGREVSDVEKIIRILSQNPAYDAENRRFSIPNTRDYFQLDIKRPFNTEISIKRIVDNS